MSWWGKVLGGTFGFMVGGPLGAVLGAALGHNLDKGMGRLQLAGPAQVEEIQSAFFTAAFSVMGHVAKADGRVSPDEISMAERIMAQMRLSPDQRQVAIRLFEQGKAPDFPLDRVLEQFRQVCHRRRNLMQMFMEMLIATALADGELTAAEERVLSRVASRLGFSARDYQGILSRIRAQAHFRQEASPQQALADAYKMLGVDAKASDEEIKKAYRRQMSQHHPDKLVARGLPKEMMEVANRKTQDIRAAYDLIKKARTRA